MDRIYLDHNATTPLDPRVLEAMQPWLREEFGNPSSVHRSGRRARAAIHAARRSVAAAIGALEEEIVFTGSGTEANNLALLGIPAAARPPAPGAHPHVVTTAVEHEAVLEPIDLLRRDGVRVTVLPVDFDGIVDPGAVELALEPDTVLLSVMAANNEVGTLQPLREISALARERGVPFHTDAVQALGKVPFRVDAPSVDAASLSAHKIRGPKGVGLLYLREGVPFAAPMAGGGQEGGRRPGTENVAAIVGFAEAVALALDGLDEKARRMEELRCRFLARCRAAVPGIVENAEAAPRLPNTLHLSVEGVDSEALVINLDLDGVEVSAGSACTSGAIEPSHVLRAMRLSPSRIAGAVRISLSPNHHEEEIDAAADRFVACVRRIRDVRESTSR